MAKTDKSTKKDKSSASSDKLANTGKEGKIELTEDELKKVSGGSATGGAGAGKIIF